MTELDPDVLKLLRLLEFVQRIPRGDIAGFLERELPGISTAVRDEVRREVAFLSPGESLTVGTVEKLGLQDALTLGRAGDRPLVHVHRRAVASAGPVAGIGHVTQNPYRVSLTTDGEAALVRARKAKSGEHSKEPPPPRLSVNLARKTLTLDGVTYDVSSENALRWVKVLAEHPGEWISGPELEKYDPQLANPRPDRWKPFLPNEFLSLIDSETGKGSRIRL
jgi:hypothetical protein